MDGAIRPLAGGCLRDKRAPVEAAIETEKQVIAPFCEWKHNGRPAGNGWNRSTNNARFGTDYFNRTGMAKSNMVVAGSYSRQGEWPPILFSVEPTQCARDLRREPAGGSCLTL